MNSIFEKIKAGDMQDVMRNASFRSACTITSNYNNDNTQSKAYDGDDATYLYSFTEGNGGRSISSYFQVVFPSPLMVDHIRVYWSGWGREGAGGYGDVKGSRTDTVKYDGVTVVTDSRYSNNNTVFYEKTYSTPTAVTTLRVDQSASDSSDENLNPRNAQNRLFTLEVYAVL